MSKVTKQEETKNVPTVAVKITAKTKFQSNSVEAVAVKDIKKREKKITTLGQSLVSLWIEQGKEILEFIQITEVSMRLASDLLGVKREALRTYCTIASDPRMLNEDFQEKLENFSQKDLIKLTKIDDEELFDEALETGVIPKEDIIDVEVDESGDAEAPAPVVEPKWSKDLNRIIGKAGDYYEAEKKLKAYFAKVAKADAKAEAEAEADEPEADNSAIVAEAIDLTGEDDIAEQALAIGVKKSALKKAMTGEMSEATLAKITDYVNS